MHQTRRKNFNFGILSVLIILSVLRNARASSPDRCLAYEFLDSYVLSLNQDDILNAVQVRRQVPDLTESSYMVWVRLRPGPAASHPTAHTLVFLHDSLADFEAVGYQLPGALSTHVLVHTDGSGELFVKLPYHAQYAAAPRCANLADGHWHLVSVSGSCAHSYTVDLDACLYRECPAREESRGVVLVYVDGKEAVRATNVCGDAYTPAVRETGRIFLGGHFGHGPLDHFPVFGSVFGFELYDVFLDGAAAREAWLRCGVPPGSLVTWADKPLFSVVPEARIKQGPFEHKCCNRYNKRLCLSDIVGRASD